MRLMGDVAINGGRCLLFSLFATVNGGRCLLFSLFATLLSNLHLCQGKFFLSRYFG